VVVHDLYDGRRQTRGRQRAGQQVVIHQVQPRAAGRALEYGAQLVEEHKRAAGCVWCGCASSRIPLCRSAGALQQVDGLPAQRKVRARA
jgi:hypothetical protein